MLGKVMKYETRAAVRSLLPVFGLALASSVVLRGLMWLLPLMWEPAREIVQGIAAGLGGLVLLAVVLITIVVVVMRFYNSMSAGEAYLTFTLPVKPGTHVVGRTLVGCLFILLSFVVAIGCGLIFIPGFAGNFSLSTVHINGTAYHAGAFSLSFGTKALIIGGIVLFCIIAVIFTQLHIYASIALGSQFGRSRALGSVVAYFVLNTVESVLSIPLMVLPLIAMVGRSIGDLEAWMQGWITPELLMQDPDSFVWRVILMVGAIMGVVLFSQLVMGVINWFITRHIYSKRLNLE